MYDIEELTSAEIADMLNDLKKAMEHNKPGDRSTKDRYFAIAITELEKLIAFWEYYLNV